MVLNQKIKVLYGVTKSNFGGAQRYVLDLAEEAKKAGFDVGVICGGNGLLVDKLKKIDIYPKSLLSLGRNVSPFFDLKSFFEIMDFLYTHKPDVFHINSSKMGGVGAVAGRLVGVKKIIFTVHGVPFGEDRAKPVLRLIKFISWVSYILCHKVIVVSKDNFEKVKRMIFMKNKVVLIPNGIEPLELVERNTARKFLSDYSHINLPGEGLWIGTISELTKNKGLEFVLEALAKIKDKEWIFVVIGSGEDKEKLEDLAFKLGIDKKVFLLGFVEGAAKYLKAFDIFTLTSVKEGHPYAILEAAGASLPTVASKISGIEDMIEDNHSGLLSKPKDVEKISKNLEKLIDDPSLRKNLGEKLKDEIEKKFSFRAMLQKTLDLYR